jgi:hypothetical protein
MNKSGHMTNSYSINRLPGNGQSSSFLPFGFYHYQHFHHSHLLWFKIITLTIQTDISETPNTRCRNGSSNSDHKAWKTNSIYQPPKDLT